MICDGTSIVWVTRSRSMVAMTASASKARSITNVAPSVNAGSIVVIAPLNTIEPECSTTDSGAIRHVPILAAYIARMKCVCWMPFGMPVVPDVYMSVQRSPGSTTHAGLGVARPGQQRTQRAIAGALVVGRRVVQHPVRAATPAASVARLVQHRPLIARTR